MSVKAISTLPCMFQTYVTYTQPLRLVLSVSPAAPLVGPYRYAKNGAISTPLRAALSRYPIRSNSRKWVCPYPLCQLRRFRRHPVCATHTLLAHSHSSRLTHYQHVPRPQDGFVCSLVSWPPWAYSLWFSFPLPLPIPAHFSLVGLRTLPTCAAAQERKEKTQMTSKRIRQI